MSSTDLTDFRNKFLARAKADLLAVDLSTANNTALIINAALLRGYDAVNKFDAIGPDAIYPLTLMSGAELNTYLSDAANAASFESILASTEARTAMVNSSAAMAAVATSSTAMTAVIASSTAIAAVAASSTAMTAVAASSTAMAAVAASSTAMTAVAASSTAMTAVAASSTAMAAVIASSTAMTAVAASSTAMTAVAASSTAMAAVIASSTAITAIFANSTALTTFKSSTALTVKSIPTMTSNTAPSGVASASSIYDTYYDAWNAFDNASGYWITPEDITTNSWVKYDFTVPVYIHTAEMKNSQAVAMCKDFRIECSQDNTSWTTALTGTQANDTALQIRNVIKAGKYRYWRLYCINSYDASFVGIVEMQLRGFA